MVSYQNAVPSTRTPSSLCVPQACNARIQSQSFRKDILDILGTNGIQVGIDGAFCNNDDCGTFASFSVL